MNSNKYVLMLAGVGLALGFSACDGGEPPIETDPVVAAFDYEVTDDFTVTFTNKSVGADSYLWEFGDGETSTDASPVHTYEAGNYTATLTATGEGGQNAATESFTLQSSIDPNSPIQLLTAGDTKGWILAKEANSVNFGPMDNDTTIWWGTPENAFESRPCLFDNVYTFNFDGTYSRDINGALWKEWKFFDAVSGEGCLDESEDAVTKQGNNVNAWKDGSFTFALSQDQTEIIVTGSGGYIGHYTSGVASSDFMPHEEHRYTITSISADRLELQSFGYGGDSDELDGYDPDQPDRLVRLVLVPAN